MVTEVAIKHGGWKKQLAYVMCRLVIEKQAAEMLGIPEEDLFFKFLSELIISIGTAFGTKKDKSEHKNSLI